MKGSFNLGHYFGIKLQIHISFLLIFLYIGFITWNHGLPLNEIAFEMLLIPLIFLCVVFHEYGHALAARRYGIGTSKIMLLPIGGVAQLKGLPKTPKQELVIAIAGPAVNLVILLLLVPVIGLFYSFESLVQIQFIDENVLGRLFAANIVLLVFNLIPAFPMDGGRVLRALLSFRINFPKATMIAARVGQLMALGFAAIGLFYESYMLIFIGAFIIMGAEAENRMVNSRKKGHTAKTIEGIITRNYMSFSPGSTIGEAVDAFLSGAGKDFPIKENGELVGILKHNDMISSLAATGRDTLIEEVMTSNLPLLEPNTSTEETIRLMSMNDTTILPVRLGNGESAVVLSAHIHELATGAVVADKNIVN